MGGKSVLRKIMQGRVLDDFSVTPVGGKCRRRSALEVIRRPKKTVGAFWNCPHLTLRSSPYYFSAIALLKRGPAPPVWILSYPVRLIRERAGEQIASRALHLAAVVLFMFTNELVGETASFGATGEVRCARRACQSASWSFTSVNRGEAGRLGGITTGGFSGCA